MLQDFFRGGLAIPLCIWLRSFRQINVLLLLVSSLDLFLNLPLNFVQPLLPNLARPLKKVFSAGQPIHLVERGVDAISKWRSAFGNDATRILCGQILKQLRNFMTESCSEMLEESSHLAEAGTTGNPVRKKPKKSATKVNSGTGEEPDFERVQKKILLFFGSLDSNLHRHLLPDPEELGQLATAIDSERHLKFPIPFPDTKPTIHLVLLLGTRF